MASTKIEVNYQQGAVAEPQPRPAVSDGTGIAGHASTMAVATARAVAKTKTMAVTRHVLRDGRGGL